MTTLWLAIFLYSVGLGLVLHIRPTLMFQANGAWKEFGYKRAPESRYTIFPVWLFAIVWAILSYALAAAFVTMSGGEEAGAVGMTAAATAYMNSPSEHDMAFAAPDDEDDVGVTMMPVSDFVPAPAEEEETMEFAMPNVRRPRGRPRKQPRPGYYVLDPATREAGLHQYVYYGSEPPTNPDVPVTRVETQ